MFFISFCFFFFFNDTAPTEIYTLSYTTLFRSPDGRLLFSNPKAREITGYGEEDMRHRKLGDIFSEGEGRSEEHTSELQSQSNLVCRLLLEKKKKKKKNTKIKHQKNLIQVSANN